jgi:ribosome maturation factor RimP
MSDSKTEQINSSINSIKEKISDFIQKATSPQASEEGNELFDYALSTHIFLLEIQISKTRTPKVIIIIDGDEGVGIADCANVSRKVGAYFEEDDLFGKDEKGEANPYNLEVTSPGVDYGLHIFRQYPQHVGRTLEFELKDGAKKIGKLQAIEEVEEDGKTKKDLQITEEYEVAEGKKGKLKTKYKPATISFEEIKVAHVQISFKKK